MLREGTQNPDLNAMESSVKTLEEIFGEHTSGHNTCCSFVENGYSMKIFVEKIVVKTLVKSSMLCLSRLLWSSCGDHYGDIRVDTYVARKTSFVGKSLGKFCSVNLCRHLCEKLLQV